MTWADFDTLEVEGGWEGLAQATEVGDSAGLREPEPKGQGQENNCEDAEVVKDGRDGCEVKEGPRGEPGARTRRLGRQAGRTQGQAPPRGGDVPREPTQRAEHLKGRKGAP